MSVHPSPVVQAVVCAVAIGVASGLALSRTPASATHNRCVPVCEALALETVFSRSVECGCAGHGPVRIVLLEE